MVSTSTPHVVPDVVSATRTSAGVVGGTGSASVATLLSVGLHPHEPVRFRPLGARRWVVGKVSRVEPDGSITLRDPEGAARSFRAEAIEVQRPGLRGRLVWRVVADVAVTWEQLELFGPSSSSI